MRGLVLEREQEDKQNALHRQKQPPARHAAYDQRGTSRDEAHMSGHMHQPGAV
jgi:hypothetical protein